MAQIIKTNTDYTINDDNSITVHIPTKRKMGGTDISKILGMNPYDTAFKTASDILNVYEENISDDPHIRAGSILEAPILDYVNANIFPLKKAEELYPNYQIGPRSQWKYHFEDDYFGGHLDALADDGAIVECKTTSDRSRFAFGTVPIHYWLQASLYAYLKGTDRIYFVVGYLTEKDLENPYQFRPSPDNIEIIEKPIHPDFDIYLQQCRDWYDKYIKHQITPIPDLSNKNDIKVFNHLYIQKMNSDMLGTAVGHYEFRLEKIEELKKSLKQLEDESDIYKEQILGFIKEHPDTEIKSLHYHYKASVVTKRIPDTERMKKDGIFDQYSKDSIYTSLRKSKN